MPRHDTWFGGWRGGLVVTSVVAAAVVYAGLRLGAESAPEGEPESLTLAASLGYGGSAMVQLAEAKGYFAADGLSLTIQDHSSGRSALDAVVSGQADLATTADLPIVLSILKGVPVTVVGTLATNDSGYGVVARKDRDIGTPADLNGKRVGLTAGSSAHFWFDAFLLRQHLVLADVRIQPLPADQLVAKLAAGEVDAISTWEPYLGGAQLALGDKGIAMSAPGIYDSAWSLAGLRDGVVARKPQAVRRLLRALLRAERYYAEEPQAALALIAKVRGGEPDALRKQLEKFRFELRLDQSLLGSLEEASRWAMRTKSVDAAAEPNFLDHLYLDGLLQVQPARVSVIR